MTSPSRRVAHLEALLGNREPGGPPTPYFFGTERHQAQAFGDATDVIELDALIAEVDRIRRERRYDEVDVAIFISRQCFPDDAQTASGIAGALIEAFWHWDKERYGEDRAWRLQRSRSDFESLIASRLAAV